MKRTVWPTGVRNKILRQLDTARNKDKRGALTAVYAKHGITPQHEVQWRKAIAKIEDASLPVEE